MQIYDIVFIVTIPFYSLAIYFLFHSLLADVESCKTKELVSYVAFSIFMIAVFMLTRLPIIFLICNVFGISLISLCYDVKLLRKLITTIIIYMVIFIVEIVVAGLLGFLEIGAFQNSEFNSVIGIITMRIVTIFISLCIYKFKKRTRMKLPIPTFYYISHILILLGTLYLFVISLENANLSLGQILISAIVVALVNGLIIFIDEKIYSSMLLHSERNILKLQNIAYENQSEIIKQSDKAIRQLRHDMKNHILSLSDMYVNQPHEASGYSKKILRQIDGNTQLVNSNNFTIDSIVNFKLQELRDTATKIKVDISIPSDLNISAYDITVILGNLLDNAVKALFNTDAEPKHLSLSINCNKGNLVILIDNSYTGKLKVHNGEYHTTNPDRSNHGLGLSSVKETILKYEGYIQIKHTDTVFSVAIVLPV